MRLLEPQDLSPSERVQSRRRREWDTLGEKPKSSPDFPSSHRSRSSSGMSASSFYGGGGDGGGGLGEDGLELTLPHKRSSFSGIKKRRILADLDNLTPAVSAPYKRVDREPEAENVAVGFKNLGNTCYLNAVLQNLLSFTPFFETLGKLRIQMRDSDSDHWSKLEGGRLLMRTLLELRKAKLKKSNVKTSLALGQFVDAYKAENPSFKGFNQHDAHEFLVLLFTNINETVEKFRYVNASAISPVEQAFEYEMVELKTCQICQKRSSQSVKDFILTLKVNFTELEENEKPIFSLCERLRETFKGETVDMTCKSCEKLTKHDAEDKLVKVPSNLILYLPRVFFKNGIPIKWSQSVKIPQFLSLQEMSDEGSLEQDARSPGNAEDQADSLNNNEDDSVVAEPPQGAFKEASPAIDADSPKKSDCAQFSPGSEAKTPSQKSGTSPVLRSCDTPSKKSCNVFRPNKPGLNKENTGLDPLDLPDASAIDDALAVLDEDEGSPAWEEIFDNSIPPESSDPRFLYRLTGSVVHVGNRADVGHFFAMVFCSESNRWVKYNDDLVEESTFEKSITHSAKNGYLFFYTHTQVLPL